MGDLFIGRGCELREKRWYSESLLNHVQKVSQGILQDWRNSAQNTIRILFTIARTLQRLKFRISLRSLVQLFWNFVPSFRGYHLENLSRITFRILRGLGSEAVKDLVKNSSGFRSESFQNSFQKPFRIWFRILPGFVFRIRFRILTGLCSEAFYDSVQKPYMIRFRIRFRSFSRFCSESLQDSIHKSLQDSVQKPCMIRFRIFPGYGSEPLQDLV